MTPPVPEQPALFLDFDGTLVEIAPRPDAIVVPPDLPDLLDRLVKTTAGAVAVVSGRTIADIEHYLKLPLPAAGMHGLERRFAPGAPVEAAPAPPELDTLRVRIKESRLLGAGIELEDKGGGLAIHYRAAPTREAEVKHFLHKAVADLAALQLIEGKMVVEAKGSGFDKGAAVDLFMESATFRGRTPVFIGDDVTDEDGMRAAIARGGFGIKVGDGASLARYRLPDVPSVHQWLASLLGIPA
jgi:trehalose 6-phosphate phosphatase